MFTPTILTLVIHVEVWMVGVYTHTPTVLILIIHVEFWVVGVYTHTPTVLTLIIHVEVWVVDVYTHCTYTDHTCRGLGGWCLHPLYLH